MLLKTLFLFFVTIYSAICCADADEIKSLPGLNFTINFKHYSGYLKTTNGKSLFYWFVESQKNPAKDPLIFWFNGGPGCSSVGGGLLSEMGPYFVNDDGETLRENPNSWNKFASVVYMDSPYGVGYSYDPKITNVATNDTQTAKENYLAMKQFFKKHPEFRNHSTFIIGESYGGIFVPTLASKIIDGSSSFPIKLEGIGIGNGLLDYGRFLIDSVEFAYSHGVLDEDVYNSYRNACCQGCSDNCQLDGGETYDCISAQNYAYRSLQRTGLNLYDIYRECEMASSKLMMTELKPMFPKFSHLKMKNSGKEGKRNKRDVPCFDDNRLEKYLDNPQVRKALHVPDYVPQNWEICNDYVHGSYVMDQAKSHQLIEKARKADIRVLLYYGDTDAVCPYFIGQKLPEQLGLSPILPKTSWEFGGKVAGMKTMYEKLTFTTLMGVGHMAPQWKPAENAYLIEEFVNKPDF